MYGSLSNMFDLYFTFSNAPNEEQTSLILITQVQPIVVTNQTTTISIGKEANLGITTYTYKDQPPVAFSKMEVPNFVSL